ncbi:phage virion morphogenesis protein [Dasania marina]|uniref:phage virion morphogenesis protein n=1 Tax=Dasania marina TaxID=471499 RepID=UPI000379B081|nr:phage virion morphogenesis protein [Dasania marina]
MSITLTGTKQLTRQIRALRTTPSERKKANRQMAKKGAAYSKKRIRSQRDLSGSPWASRKAKSRRKMLRGLSRTMVAFGDEKKGTIGYKNALTGQIARAHQEGINETLTAEKAQRINGTPNYDGPATTKQAKALRAEGYKIRRTGSKGYKKATIKWIKQNIKLGQAGLILRIMRDEKSKSSWAIPLPERSFLGVTPSEREQMMDFIFNNTLHNVKG